MSLADKRINIKIQTEKDEKISLSDLLKEKISSRSIQQIDSIATIFWQGKRISRDQLLKNGDEVEIVIPENYIQKKIDQLKKRIIFEDCQFIAINKWSGIEAVEDFTPNIWSLFAFLNCYLEKKNERAFPIHRLDYHTSGVLLFAKDKITQKGLNELFLRRKIDKNYQTLVRGIIAENEKIRTTISHHGKELTAISELKVLENFYHSQVTLLEVKLVTGRFHQIRIQLSRRNHPVVMDKQHGDFKFNKNFRHLFGLQRQFLHCQRICFNYSGIDYELEAPLENDLLSCLLKIREFERSKKFRDQK